MKQLFFLVCLLLAHNFANADIALNPDVRQDTIANTICVAGYTKTVRPAVSYTNGVKKKLILAQQLPISSIGNYELDHIVPLTLGGHPRSLNNLQLELWEGANGAKVKDKLEVRLNKLVCSGTLALSEAQSCIYNNWQQCALLHPTKGK